MPFRGFKVHLRDTDTNNEVGTDESLHHLGSSLSDRRIQSDAVNNPPGLSPSLMINTYTPEDSFCQSSHLQGVGGMRYNHCHGIRPRQHWYRRCKHFYFPSSSS